MREKAHTDEDDFRKNTGSWGVELPNSAACFGKVRIAHQTSMTIASTTYFINTKGHEYQAIRAVYGKGLAD
jgi:hypothetical protein